MSAWKVLSVDDEPPIRAEIRYLLEQDPRVDEVLEAGSVSAAMAAIMEQDIDVVFLDISMPGVSGMKLAEFLQDLNEPPTVVFVTAYSEYAADAYDLDVADYLLKPVELDRVVRALDKVELLKQKHKRVTKRPVRIQVDNHGLQSYILVRDICYIEARGDYASIFTKDHEYLIKSTLSALEERLEPEGFMRIHKSFIVNMSQIDTVRSVGHGLLELVLFDDQQVLPVSRRKAMLVKRALGLSDQRL